MCRREVVVGRPIQNPRAPVRLSGRAVQARMMILLSPSGRLQMDRWRFPRFESTARVVAKAEAGVTNEVMFWSASRIRLWKARRRLEPEQLISVSNRRWELQEASQGDRGGGGRSNSVKQLRSQRIEKVVGREVQAQSSRQNCSALQCTTPMLTLGACRSVHQSSCSQ